MHTYWKLDFSPETNDMIAVLARCRDLVMLSGGEDSFVRDFPIVRKKIS